MAAVHVASVLGTAVMAAAAALAAPAIAEAATAQQAIAFLNEQRAAHGIPAGIVEDPTRSEGCRLHNRYVQLNGEDVNRPHWEDPGKPGFTDLGALAASRSVLGGGAWAAGSNPWEGFPFHLMSTLSPALAKTGYDDNCMWTFAGDADRRPGPKDPVAYTYPGDGAAIYPRQQVSGEWPFAPGDLVGLPQGEATTGPHVFVMLFGADIEWSVRARVVGASLTGEAGPVDIRTVDAFTPTPTGGTAAGLVEPGAILIPVAPLAPSATYRAGVTLEYNVGNGPTLLTHNWSFVTTGRNRAALSIELTNARGIQVDSDHPVDAMVEVRRLPSRRLVLRARSNGSTIANMLPGGRYELCASVPETESIAADRVCIVRAWRTKPSMRMSSHRAGSALRVLLVSADLVGRRALVRAERLGACRRTCRPRVVRQSIALRRRTAVELPAGAWVVTVRTKPFRRGELWFAGATYVRRAAVR